MDACLYQIIYISAACDELTEEALLELLAKSQKRNSARQITGLLLHSDGNIIQIMEGPETAVKALYEKVAADPRHKSVTLISSKPVKARDFPNYKMGFKRVLPETLNRELPGFSDVIERGRFEERDLAGLSKVVTTFIKAFARSTRVDYFGRIA